MRCGMCKLRLRSPSPLDMKIKFVVDSVFSARVAPPTTLVSNGGAGEDAAQGQ